MDKKQVILKHLARNARLLLMAFIITALTLAAQPATPVMAQSAQDGFNASATGTVNAIALQPDGKILVGGAFNFINGEARSQIARLHPDGSLDDGFNPGANAVVLSLILQPDGKILVGGSFSVLGGQPYQSIARLNLDGSLDHGFFNPGVGGIQPEVSAMAIQPDGKILIGGTFTEVGGQPRLRIARINPDGSLDQSFNPGANGSIQALALQTDGKILIGGTFTKLGGEDRAYFARLHPDGTPDQDFNAGANGAIHSLGLQVDGKILVGGDFTQMGDQPRQRIARLHPDSSLDQSFQLEANGIIRVFALQSDGKILVGGSFTELGGEDRAYIARLHPTGLIDQSFYPSANNRVQAIAVQPEGKILVGGAFTQLGGQSRLRISRLHTDGSLELDFLVYANWNVTVLALQPDGKILVGGWFWQIGDQSDIQDRSRIARLNQDGSLDQSFNPGANSWPNAISVQPDGKILVGGRFTELGGQTRMRIARLHPNGSLDQDFNPGANHWVRTIAVQPDGKILVGGRFTELGGQDRAYIARLHPNGDLDQDFKPEVYGDSEFSSVNTILVQPDGKILVGGEFTELGGQPRQHIGRLHPDGSLDQDFNPGADGQVVLTMVLQPDGKILVGGYFTELGGQPRLHIGRLHPDGSLDQDFNPGANSMVRTIAVQPDGKILVGGGFTELGGELRHRIARLHPSGAIDLGFDIGASELVRAIALQPDGKVLLGGNFQGLGDQPRNSIGRLSNNTAALQHLAVSASRDRITWMRGGSGPEVWRVTFETSSNGQTYTPLGEGTRIPGGWALDGLNLPVGSSFIRARGYYTTGDYNGSASIVESVRLVYLTQAPAITNQDTTAFTVGTSSSFTVTAAGYPAPELTISGALPDGVTFTDNADGTATLSGMPTPGSVGTHKLTITASNGVGADAVQAFTLSVNQVPAITSGATTAFTVGTPGSFAVTATGHPTPGLAISGALPDGVTFTDNGNGTATLAGTPAAGSGGVYNLTITASNGVGADAEQAFTLTINESPNITSVSSTTFTVGTSGLFTVTAAGHPSPALKISGALPDGVTFTDNGNGTATLAGTPAGGSGGVYDLTITASNGVGVDAEQAFTLTVEAAKPEGFRFFLPLVVR